MANHVDAGVGEVVDYRESGLDPRFLRLLRKRQEADLIIKDAEAAKKEANKELLAMLTESGHKTVITPDWRVTFTQGVHVQISKQRLLDQGVSVKIIEKSTTRTTYETVTVTAVKEE